MESNSTTRSQKIIQIIEKLIPILNMPDINSSAQMWGLYFEKILTELNRPHEPYKIAEELIKLFGGMGSFNDLVLQKNFKILAENDKLWLLRHELYVLIDEIIVEHRGGYINHHPDEDCEFKLQLRQPR